MVELMSKIIRNAQAGCRGDGNLIEQNDIFVHKCYYHLMEVIFLCVLVWFAITAQIMTI